LNTVLDEIRKEGIETELVQFAVSPPGLHRLLQVF
jgi:hypothetical protein